MYQRVSTIYSYLLFDILKTIREDENRLCENEWVLLTNFLNNSSILFEATHYFSPEDNDEDSKRGISNLICFRSEEVCFTILSNINLHSVGLSLSILDATKLYLTNKPKLHYIEFKKVETE